jgi:cobalt/nickel transport system permease protein
MVAYAIFRIINQKSENPRRMQIAAFFAGYISLNITAIVTAVEFGIQPLIAHTADGQALYTPFPLKYAIPAMALEHLFIFGIIEGIITALLFRYFYHTNREMVEVMK